MKKILPGANIAFIGLGVMGSSMAQNLLNAGFNLKVFTRTKSKAQNVIDSGAIWCNSAASCVIDVDAVITIVGYPKDVREIYLSENGIIANAAAGTLLIDMTTSDPSLAVEIAEAAEVRGMKSIDAPVSGGDVGAKSSTLSIMCGSDPVAFSAAEAVFDILGKTVVLQGRPGSGQHTKMCNQIAIATNMIGIVEALLYARKSGLDPSVVLESIGSGAAGSWSLSNLYPRIVKGDYDPGFYIIHFIKDMEIAVREASFMNLTLPGLNMALEFYKKLAAQGDGLLGTQALYKVLDELNN